MNENVKESSENVEIATRMPSGAANVLLKYSRSCYAVYQALKHNPIHPDCETLVGLVRQQLPAIGMTTVYRSLKKLVDAGLVHTLETTKDSIHYDANITPHAHFICSKCGKIIDVFTPVTVPAASELSGCAVDSCKVVMYGTCDECNN